MTGPVVFIRCPCGFAWWAEAAGQDTIRCLECGEEIEDVICKACQADHHKDCKGGTWCDCQHSDRIQFPVRRPR